MFCSFLTNAWENVSSVSAARCTVWLFSALPLFCDWGKGGTVQGVMQ